MNRNIILGFVSGLVFTASLVIGLVIADAATDQGGGERQLPGALGDPIQLASGIPIADPDAPVDFDQPIEPTQAAHVGYDRGGQQNSATGFDQSLTEIDPTPGDGATTELTVAPLRGAPLAPVEIDPRFEELFTGDLFFEFIEFPPFRFLDLCADDGALPGCPLGVGGTVLAPLDDPSLGDFRLGAVLSDASGTGGACEIPEEGERQLFVWANHPAQFEITSRPDLQPSLTSTVTVANTDPADPEFIRFTENSVEGRLATSPWPRACFNLSPSLSYSVYTVEVSATSLFGETASATYTVDITEGPRPPVVLIPWDDHNTRVHIPIKGGIQRVGMSVVPQSDDATCAQLEAEGRFFDFLPGDESGYLSDGGGQAAYGEASPSWPYDPAYNRQRTIDIFDLKEGSVYLVCIWWFESRERSFDDPLVVERERRWITTPNRLTALIRARAVENFSGRALAADSYTVSFRCPSDSRVITIPPRDLVSREGVALPGDPVVCDYAGRQIRIPTIGFFTTPEGARGDFAIALDPTSERGFQRIDVDLSTAEERGPLLALSVSYPQGSDRGGDRWLTGAPLIFEPLSDESGLPAEIRIDTFASGVDPDGRDGIRVTGQFDRPVRLTASLLGEPCLTGPEPSFASGGLSQFYSFRLDGLCLRTRYSVVLEVEDAAGSTASFADVAPGLPEYPGARYFGGTGWTDGYNVEYTVTTSAGSPAAGRQAHVERFGATIDGVDFDLRGRGRCLAENRESEGLVRSGTDVWGDEITVTVSFWAKQSFRETGTIDCVPYPDYGYRQWGGSITATFSIAAFQSGAITVPFLAHDTVLGGPSFDIAVIITGRVIE